MADSTEQLAQARAIARLEAQVEGMGREIGELKDSMRTLVSTVDGMRAQLSEARGGWKTLMLLGGASASAGGAVAWVVQHLTGKGM